MYGWLLLWGVAILAGLISLTQHLQYFPHYIILWLVSLLPWLLVFLLPSLVAAVAFRRRILCVCLLLPIIYIVHSQATLFLTNKSPEQNGPFLRILSYNIWSINQNIHDVSGVIQELDPDIIFFQEVTEDNLEVLRRDINDIDTKLQWFNRYEPDQLLAIFSRFPLFSSQKVGTERTRIQMAMTRFFGHDVTLYNVHFVRGSMNKRQKEIKSFIETNFLQAEKAYILAGDLNATSHTPIYNMLKNTMISSYDQAGWGFGFTYPAQFSFLSFKFPALPMVRIDHIFHSNHFIDLSAETVHMSGGSDHLPVLAVLTMVTRDN